MADTTTVQILNSILDTMSKRVPTAMQTAAMDESAQNTLLNMRKYESDTEYKENILAGEREGRRATAKYQSDVLAGDLEGRRATADWRTLTEEGRQAEVLATAGYRDKILARTPEIPMMPRGKVLAETYGGNPEDLMPVAEYANMFKLYIDYEKGANPDMFKPFMDKKYFDPSHKDYIDFTKINASEAKNMMSMYQSGSQWDNILNRMKVENRIQDLKTPNLVEFKGSDWETSWGGYDENFQLDVIDGIETSSQNLWNLASIDAQVSSLKRLYQKDPVTGQRDPRAVTAVNSLGNILEELMMSQFYTPDYSMDKTRAFNSMSRGLSEYKTITGNQWVPSSSVTKVDEDVIARYPHIKEWVKNNLSSSAAAGGSTVSGKPVGLPSIQKMKYYSNKAGKESLKGGYPTYTAKRTKKTILMEAYGFTAEQADWIIANYK